MIKNLRLRLLSYVVIVYMLIAFSWWSVLLYTKNQDAFQAKAEYWKLVLVAEGKINAAEEFYQTEIYQSLRQKYKRQEWMIFGEGAVFVLSLVIGMWLINRSYHKEMDTAQQRRNFLLSITHELKSPLASIRLVLETFQKRKQLKPALVDKLSGNALEEAERLNTLVNDLLLAARMETSLKPHFERIPIEALLEEIIDKLRNKYPHAIFSLHADESLPSLMADKSMMASVALNLLENAVKYSVESPTIDIKLSTKGKQLIWTTADQGMGIPDKEKKQVFSRFYRIGNEDTRKTKGTGLGLYIVKQIIEAHQGKVSIGNNKPTGTIFTISLPLAQHS